MLEEDDLAALGHNSPEYIHLVTEALKLAYADRHAHFGDPLMTDVPEEGLLSKRYAKARRGLIDAEAGLAGDAAGRRSVDRRRHPAGRSGPERRVPGRPAPPRSTPAT